jgi:radical SAM superfamily enzyme
VTLKRIAKGATFDEHVEGARRAHTAGIKLSAIFLLGVGGIDRSEEHAVASARLVTEMNPAYTSLLTLTVVPETPIARLEEKGKFELPSVPRMLEELRTIVMLAEPTESVFRTNHASNYLPLGGVLPHERDRILSVVDRALAGNVRLRPEWARGL